MSSKYAKFIVAVLGVIALGLQQFLGIGDGSTIFGLPVDQVAAVIIALLTAIGVRQVPNAPSE